MTEGNNEKQSNIPEISVVIPVYNSGQFLKESLDSVLNQTFSDFEVICVYDKSKDNSLEILEQYARKDDRVKIIVNEEKKGLPYALNLGLNAARGKYIARMDADDISLPARFEVQYNFLEKHPDIGGCGSLIKKIGRAKRKIRQPLKDEDIRVRLMFNCCIMHPTVMLRTSVIKENNLFYNEEYKVCEDFEYWIRFTNNAKFCNLPETLLLYRVSDESICESQKSLIEELECSLVKQQFENKLSIDKNSVLISKLFNKDTCGRELFECYRDVLVFAKKSKKIDYKKFKKYFRHFLYKRCYNRFKSDKKLNSLFDTIRYNRLAFLFVLFNIVRVRSMK